MRCGWSSGKRRGTGERVWDGSWLEVLPGHWYLPGGFTRRDKGKRLRRLTRHPGTAGFMQGVPVGTSKTSSRIISSRAFLHRHWGLISSLILYERLVNSISEWLSNVAWPTWVLYLVHQGTSSRRGGGPLVACGGRPHRKDYSDATGHWDRPSPQSGSLHSIGRRHSHSQTSDN
jgi:hypothetical protein